jgi:hypothetical protein
MHRIVFTMLRQRSKQLAGDAAPESKALETKPELAGNVAAGR